MDVDHLRRRGWSEREIIRAQQIFARAEHPEIKRIEHITFYLSILVLYLFSMAIIVSMAFLGPISFLVLLLLGICVGLFYAHIMHTLKIHNHSVFGIFILLVLGGSILLITRIPSSFLFAVVMCVGVVMPYVFDRRLHGPA